ncbi:hypothetical protein IGI04_026000 [Brassica rapa subsp. trilocularis]|uniref:Uncharacterized protein n=1 Tax=Brassica rapa subsp. trilocularis TaxID=1813537 RepID=A0ABQ7KUP9_BRACM|nr:hypothetical protein IGI04_026000 [Brassica rapa subsp. trilocularis]
MPGDRAVTHSLHSQPGDGILCAGVSPPPCLAARLRMPRLRLQILITLRHEAEATSRGSDYASWMRLLSLTDLMEFSKKGEDD